MFNLQQIQIFRGKTSRKQDGGEPTRSSQVGSSYFHKIISKEGGICKFFLLIKMWKRSYFLDSQAYLFVLQMFFLTRGSSVDSLKCRQ